MDYSNINDIEMLSEISEDKIKEFVQKNEMYKQTYKKNVTIYCQGNICETMDIVLSGNLVAYSISANGSENIMFEFKKGNIIGGNLLFGENNNYPFNIYCRKECKVLHIDKNAVASLIKNYNFAMLFIRSLSFNSYGMNKKITMFTQKTLRDNLMDYLKSQVIEQKSQIITLPITKKELADYLGVQRPSLFREMKRLKEEGIIKINNKKIIICDIDY